MSTPNSPMNDLALFDELRSTQVQTYDNGQEISGFERVTIGLTTLGLLGFFASFYPPIGRAMGWPGFLAVFGLLGGGAMLWATATYRGTEPGIKHDGVFFEKSKTRSYLTYTATVLVTFMYVCLWWWGDWAPQALQHLNPLDGGIALVDPLSRLMNGGPADKWFFYTAMYSFAVSVFAVRMFWKYRHNRYHLVRTASVVWFQTIIAFTLPMLMKNFGTKEHYFNYFWPLKPEYLMPWGVDYALTFDSIGRSIVLWTLLVSVVGVPVLTYFFGKRWYCSWICGCGALAETFGDGWRQMSDKSERAWKLERISIHSVLVIITVLTIGMWANELTGRAWFSDGQSTTAWKLYTFFITAGFAGALGTGFYPVLGNRIWCRFGCPQAAVLGILQRFFSRFRITTNGGQCISCGNCSTYCEMGIDVRAYAQRGDNIVRASCVGCGVCAAVCPRGVLKLENGPVGDRFQGADEPFAEFMRSVGLRSRD